MRKQPERGGVSPRPKGSAPIQQKKRYRSPRLAVYGELGRIAMAKGGVRGDGSGAPRTKV
jgi:hypothetical protein